MHSPHGTLHRTKAGWRAEFLGVARELGDPPDWAAGADDPRSQLWRMNLHYFEYLPDLAAEDGRALISDWIARCRPGGRAAVSAPWTAYAVSLRLSAWLDFWSREGGDADFAARLAASIHEQTEYLCARLETDVRGNHLVKNIRALTEAAAALDASAPDRWRRLADRWLARELEAQVLPDGVHFERSPSYHAQVFADLLTIAAIRGRDALTPRLEETLDRMAPALADLTHPDGYCAQFNDSGLTMAAAPGGLLAAYAAWRGRPAPAPQARFAYRDAGFYGARLGDDYLVVKMGPLGPDALMAHAHGDFGSFEWSVAGRRVIVDQGVFEYVAGDKRRQSRSAAAHNTAFAGAEQADFFGAFRCGARPHPPPADYQETESGFRLSGRITPAGPGGGAPLTRTLIYEDGVLTIEDAIGSAGPETRITSRLLLHPEVICTPQTSASLLAVGEVRVSVSCDTAQAVEPAEWWPDMGQAIETRRILARGEGRVKTRMARLLSAPNHEAGKPA